MNYINNAKYCVACGKENTLEAVPVPDGYDVPLLERGEFDGQKYLEEQEVTILKCRECGQEQVAL